MIQPICLTQTVTVTLLALQSDKLDNSEMMDKSRSNNVFRSDVDAASHFKTNDKHLIVCVCVCRRNLLYYLIGGLFIFKEIA